LAQALHRNVMLENYQNLLSVGIPVSRLDLISLLAKKFNLITHQKIHNGEKQNILK
uniref:KRAB domain-containing protein n=1 Tax=Sarcophilus harrisii TaxID=9305 RepID=A0A7N4UZK7_SARHA